VVVCLLLTSKVKSLRTEDFSPTSLLCKFCQKKMREKVTEVELPWTLDRFLLTENEDISQSCRFNWNRCLPPTRLTIPRAGLNDLIPELTYWICWTYWWKMGLVCFSGPAETQKDATSLFWITMEKLKVFWPNLNAQDFARFHPKSDILTGTSGNLFEIDFDCKFYSCTFKFLLIACRCIVLCISVYYSDCICLAFSALL